MSTLCEGWMGKRCAVCAGIGVAFDLLKGPLKFAYEAAKAAIYSTLRWNVVGALNFALPFAGGLLGGIAFDTAASSLLFGVKWLCGVSARNWNAAAPKEKKKIDKMSNLANRKDIGLRQGPDWNTLAGIDDCEIKMLREKNTDIGQWKRLKTMIHDPIVFWSNSRRMDKELGLKSGRAKVAPGPETQDSGKIRALDNPNEEMQDYIDRKGGRKAAEDQLKKVERIF